MSQEEKLDRGQHVDKIGRDRTRFDVTIGNDTYTSQPKRKAMYHVVKCLCASGVTPEEIVKAAKKKPEMFFRSFEGSLSSAEFIQNLLEERAKNDGRSFNPEHYFCKSDELIRSQGRTYALHNQWGDSFKPVIQHLMAAFPDHNIVCKPSL